MDRTTCRSQNTSLTLLGSVLCAREISVIFKCSVIDVNIEDEKLPTNIPFSILRYFDWVLGDTMIFVVNGTAVKHPKNKEIAFYNTVDKSIEFNEYKVPNSSSSTCKKRWDKKGKVGILIEFFIRSISY